MNAELSAQVEVPSLGSGSGPIPGTGSTGAGYQPTALEREVAGLIHKLETLHIVPGPVLTIVCSWCGKTQKEGDGRAGISHTICPACQVKYFPESVVKVRTEGELL